MYVYEFLLALYSNYVHIMHRFRNVATQWSKITDFNVPHLYLTPMLGWPHRKLAKEPQVRHCLHPAVLVELQLVMDAQTDGAAAYTH